MSYYKNTQIASRYKVSNSTVGEWIKGARAGKNNLQVRKYRNKDRILENEHNEAEMARLKEKGVKYKTSAAAKKTTPKKEFYEIFDENEIVEILNSIKTRSIIDLKFYYVQADHWAKVFSETWLPGHNSNITAYEMVLNSGYHKSASGVCNIIDLGPGTGDPIIDFLKKIGKESFRSYTAVDYSEGILNLSTNLIKQNFPAVSTSSFRVDFEQTNFSSVFIESLSDNLSGDSNIIFLTGLTLPNCLYRDKVLTNIANSMFGDDVFIFDYSLDTVKNRNSFASIKGNKTEPVYILEDMGIDVSLCTYKYVFDKNDIAKKVFLVIDKDYEIEFILKNRKFVFKIEKNTEICIWRHSLAREIDIINDINKAGLSLLKYSLDETGNQGIYITKLKN